MKKLSTLLARRQAILQQARLANLAFAYQTLLTFQQRIARAGLQGRVTLRPADPDAERYWASLTAHEGRQSMIEEHFSEEELMDLADVLAFVAGNDAAQFTFRLEEVSEIILVPLRVELEREGIAIDSSDTPVEQR